MQIMKYIKEVLLVLWQLPQELLGAVIWLICVIRKCKIETYCGRALTEWNFLSGLSLGHFIFVHDDTDGRLVNHEYGHTRQSRYLGVLFLFVVGIPSIIWAGCFGKYRAAKRISYYSFYTEKWADKLGGVVR